MRLILIFILCFWAQCTKSTECPTQYLRFSTAHTLCLKPNRKCNIKKSGVSTKETNLIVGYHNAFRNITAMGKESRAKGGTLPQAADMLQMVWDPELAAIAQKWTDNCVYDHDCSNGCRTVRNFEVGQNLARHSASCAKKKCTKDENRTVRKPDWEGTIRSFYDEVGIYQKAWFSSYEQKDKVVGHFTQIVWSKSWRVGCGFTAYKEKKVYHRFYACNYGPGGNIAGQPLYMKGKPCSACPGNTCCGKSCGKSCGKKMEYPGLCKMLDPEKAPSYYKETKKDIFYCDSLRKTKDCSVKITGTKKWYIVKSLSGNLMSVELRGGQETTLIFHHKIKPSGSSFCVQVIYRKGPSKAEDKDTSIAKVLLSTDGGGVTTKGLQNTSTQFSTYKITLNWQKPTKISIVFSVPSGGKPHIFDVKEVMAYNGQCET